MPTDNRAAAQGLLAALDKIGSVADDPEQVKRAVADARTHRGGVARSGRRLPAGTQPPAATHATAPDDAGINYSGITGSAVQRQFQIWPGWLW